QRVSYHEETMISEAAKARISTLSAPLGSVVGETPEIQKIYHIVQTAARTTHPVLIVGEVGTGKEVIARTIHSTGPFQRMPFVNVDCALIETAGLERVLLSGPDQGLLHSKAGCVTGAYRGTLFLDRIGDLNLEAQARLLRAL